jgi:hypothetical protein
MKLRKGLAAVTITAILTGTALAQTTRLELPETNSTITLSFVPDREFPQDFRTVVIHSAGTITRITAHDQFIRIPATREDRKKAFIWSADASGLKIDPSRYFLLGNYTATGKPHTLLFFLGEAAASDAAPLLIIGFTGAGKPFKLFGRKYELTSFQQADEGALMTGNESVSQGVCGYPDPKSPSSTTYDPYSVFLIQPDKKPVYLLDASRDYNLKHYVWAGPRAAESITVIYNLPGHPKVFAASNVRAQKLMAKVKCLP